MPFYPQCAFGTTYLKMNNYLCTDYWASQLSCAQKSPDKLSRAIEYINEILAANWGDRE